jgi:hypothetical protein
MDKVPSPASHAELARHAEQLDAGLPADVRQKLDELRRQSLALPRPTDLRQESLRAIKDVDLDDAIAWYVGERMRTSGLSREAVLRQEPAALKTFYLAWLLEAEVMNGGFNQYFWNVSQELVEQTPGALMRLGATQVADMVESAIARGREEASMRDAFKGQRTLQGFSDSYKLSKLDEYDKRFVQLAADLPGRRAAYLRAHERAFSTGEP